MASTDLTLSIDHWYGTPEGLVATAVKEFKAGRCDGIRFDVFNKNEADEVRERMKAHPEIPFRITRAI